MEQLKMWRYVVQDGKPMKDATVTFTALINPAEVKRDVQLSYSHLKSTKPRSTQPKLHAIDEEKLSFSLVLDSTGVVPMKKGVTQGGVAQQLAHLRAILYTKAPSTRDLAQVYIVWGEFSFFGRLTSMSVAQTLFAPDGRPLRAKVSLGFAGAPTAAEATRALEQKGSTNASQTREVQEGDTLAHLCGIVCGDPALSFTVARHNGLPSLRTIKPGTQLVFPASGPRS